MHRRELWLRHRCDFRCRRGDQGSHDNQNQSLDWPWAVSWHRLGLWSQNKLGVDVESKAGSWRWFGDWNWYRHGLRHIWKVSLSANGGISEVIVSFSATGGDSGALAILTSPGVVASFSTTEGDPTILLACRGRWGAGHILLWRLWGAWCLLRSNVGHLMELH